MIKVKSYNSSTTSLRSKKEILLYLFLIPLFIAVILVLFQTNIQAFLLNSLAFTLFFTTAKLSTKGFTQELEHLRSPLTKAPKIPYKTIGEVKTKLSNIEKHMDQIEDTLLYGKLNIAVTKARNILETIQKDPKDIRVTRKFLIVYIDGIAKVTDFYVAMDEDDIKSETRDRLYTLMEDLDTRFDKELEILKSNNQFDLDVHINVLKEQIKN